MAAPSNTPTPAQALGEVMALSELGTPSPWRWEYNQRSKNVEIAGGKPTFDKTVMDFHRWGMSSAQPRFMATQDSFRIMHKLSDRPDWIAPIEGREHHADWCADVVHPDAALMVAAVNFIRQHGQHFAGLEKEVERLNTVIGVYHDRLYAAEVKAEAAEARCAELEAALSNSVGADWHNDEVANAARTNGEAREILAKAIDVVRDAATDARMAGHIKRGEYLDELASIIAAFLAARG